MIRDSTYKGTGINSPKLGCTRHNQARQGREMAGSVALRRVRSPHPPAPLPMQPWNTRSHGARGAEGFTLGCATDLVWSKTRLFISPGAGPFPLPGNTWEFWWASEYLDPPYRLSESERAKTACRAQHVSHRSMRTFLSTHPTATGHFATKRLNRAFCSAFE